MQEFQWLNRLVMHEGYQENTCGKARGGGVRREDRTRSVSDLRATKTCAELCLDKFNVVLIVLYLFHITLHKGVFNSVRLRNVSDSLPENHELRKGWR